MNRRDVFCAVLLLLSLVTFARGEDPARTSSCEMNAVRSNIAIGKTQVVAIIDDPSTCQRWCLQLNPEHPGWPAKLIMVEAGDDSCKATLVSQGIHSLQSAKPIREPQVHAGEVLAVSDESAAMRAEFEGVALSSGFKGDLIKVRLRYAARVVSAQIAGGRRARLIHDVREVKR